MNKMTSSINNCFNDVFLTCKSTSYSRTILHENNTIRLGLVFQPLAFPHHAKTFVLLLQWRTTYLFLFLDAIVISFNFVNNLRRNYIFLTSDDVVAIIHPKTSSTEVACRGEKKFVNKLVNRH